jgi:hypothetical protein
VIAFQTLQTVEAAAKRRNRPVLFSCLAAKAAAVRADAAKTILAKYGLGAKTRAGLARDFGYEPDAVLTPLLAELAQAIGWELSPAWQKFRASQNIGHDEWREGIGYDLTALAAATPEERAIYKQWLRSRLTDAWFLQIDWRHLEAAAAFGDKVLLKELTGHGRHDIRFRAQQLLGHRKGIETELCRIVRESEDLGEFARAKIQLPEHKSRQVRTAMIERLKRCDEVFVPMAMTFLEIFLDAGDSWSERPELFRIKEEGGEGPLMEAFLERINRR